MENTEGNGGPQADDGGEQVLINDDWWMMTDGWWLMIDDRNMQFFEVLFGGLELFE